MTYMKCYGYSTDEEDKLLELIEVTIQFSPEKLRQTASFLTKCADAIEKDEEWEHEHLSDNLGEDVDVDMIVYKPS